MTTGEGNDGLTLDMPDDYNTPERKLKLKVASVVTALVFLLQLVSVVISAVEISQQTEWTWQYLLLISTAVPFIESCLQLWLQYWQYKLQMSLEDQLTLTRADDKRSKFLVKMNFRNHMTNFFLFLSWHCNLFSTSILN